jgi:translation initiation factor IF-3
MINDAIKASKVRLIAEDGEQVGIIPMEKARALAKEAELDLVQVAEGETPVCRIMNYGKHIFQQSKQKQGAKKKQKKVQVKEIKLRPGTDDGDYQVKLRNLIRFLENGDRAKITVRFRGREIAHHELGVQMLKRLEEDLAEYGDVEQQSKFEGRQMMMVLAPKKKK